MQTIGARFAHGELTLQQAAELGCRACGSPGGGCQFLGTAATSQVVGECCSACRCPIRALALRAADLARHAARALGLALVQLKKSDTLPRHSHPAALKNAMAVDAAVGGSTNLLLAHPGHRRLRAGLDRPTVEDWNAINLARPPPGRHAAQRPGRSSDDTPLPRGGVLEVMLHPRDGAARSNGVNGHGRAVRQALDW
ncbi:MAG: dihydroxy-acid dehydratase [Gemmataceae bacterium]